jgi:hypothetical protein
MLKNYPKNTIAQIIWYAANSRFGNRLEDGITIGCKSISAVVPAGHYKLSFSCYLHLW